MPSQHVEWVVQRSCLACGELERDEHHNPVTHTRAQLALPAGHPLACSPRCGRCGSTMLFGEAEREVTTVNPAVVWPRLVSGRPTKAVTAARAAAEAAALATVVSPSAN